VDPPRERRLPLATARRFTRYYPGFWGALFLIALRVAVGWHFLYEGLWKLEQKDGKPFSAEGYFRASAGPLSPYFRSLIPDADGLERLRRDEAGRPVALKATWDAELARTAAHYGFDATQKAEAAAILDRTKSDADNWFRDIDNAQKVKKYEDDLARVNAVEADPATITAKREGAWKDRQKLNADRKDLLAQLDTWTGAMKDAWAKLAREPQQAAGPVPAAWTRLDWLNRLTMWGLIVAGACLILGLLTPVAALWCAGFLALIYFSLPPWPGLPDNPLSEGHYWIVNKNLIEMFACLVLASTPTGLWVGLDALLFGWIDRRRAASALASEGVDGMDDDVVESRRLGTVTRSDRR
jgi:uncharacterized membrane protein YphA (DoxX/SURF4 family)